MRYILLFIISFLVLVAFSSSEVFNQAQEKADADVIYPKERIWTTPSYGEEPAFNSPSFQWPSSKNAKYSVRISSSDDFNRDLIEKEEIPYAIFNPHKKLGAGIWYWQYKVNDEKWNKTDSFLIKPSTRIFETPEVKVLLAGVPLSHPRVLVNKADFNAFRIRAKEYKESSLIIREANNYLDKLPPKEESALPSFRGKDEFENEKIASLASKWAGWKVYNAINSLSQAYLLTGDTKYFNTAEKWMLEVSTWDPNGPSHTNNFGDAGIMAGLAIGADTFWDLLSATEREGIIKQSSIRASQFYKLWIGQVESRSSSMHVWQHILHHLLQTSLAFKGEIPEADLWLEYIYEIWIAQAPKMGEEDGAWFNGTSYFGMNTLTLIDVSSIFKELSGVDFMRSEWFNNNPGWLIYAFPANSVSDGFCNDGERYPFPPINYAGYSDAMARLLNNPYAAWYAQAVTRSSGNEIADEDEFRWFRIKRGYKMTLPEPVKESDILQAARFPDIGVAYMHTSLENAKTDLMLSVRSSPFGPMAHAHADQNTFNIAYGGKRLFYNTGYRPAMGDPHFLGWYKHTRGHNGVLIDGEGQPFSDVAYGYLPRFLHGKQISYAVGDASNAYSGTDEGVKTDHGIKLFRRHYIMLRPSTIVIYDELEADHAAEWSWLLHNDNGLKIDPDKKIIIAGSEVAKAQVSLYSSSEIEFMVTDQFSVPVDNWTNKIDEEGDTIVFKNQWHFSGVSKQKTEKMRFLAIIQVKPDGSFELVTSNKNDGVFTVGNWNINAEMNSSKPANLQIWNNYNSASLVSDGILNNKGKTYIGKEISSSKLLEIIDGKEVFKEAVDEIPASIQKAMKRN
ncbi:MAG: DUF4962 domain-containing protein [Bacteroidia bacterium]|nr:DUF4962 domain-containing protein [Bacteroidia bacterium]